MSMMVRWWVLGILGAYGWASATGWRLATQPHERIPASVRSSPGGYRSFHFWHTGFMGGK